MNKIRGRTLSEISVQYGFMPDRGARNAIFVLRRLEERMIEKHKAVYVCFIDYSNAFDTVKHEPLIELQQSLDIDPQDVKLLANLYWNQQAAVRDTMEKLVNQLVSSREFGRDALHHRIYLFYTLK